MRKLVVDTSSIFAFLNYYRFDSNDSKRVQQTLRNFIIGKVLSDEVIIIDKVFEELRDTDADVIDFKSQIKSKVVNTKVLSPQVAIISKKYYLSQNEQLYKNPLDIPRAITKFENSADPFLLALCMYLKNNKKEQVMLVTEESRKFDSKLHEKIPTMCDSETISCKNLPYALFDHYKAELKFALSVVAPVPPQPKF